MKPVVDVMIDLETMSRRPDAAIVQIGACEFDRRTGHVVSTFEVNVSLSSSMDAGLAVDADTIEFWLRQPHRDFLDDPRTDLMEALKNLSAWLLARSAGCIVIWSHATFDIPILAFAYFSIGEHSPFGYRAARDLRTLFDLVGGVPNVGENHRPHNALADCRFQVLQVAECMKVLSILRPPFGDPVKEGA